MTFELPNRTLTTFPSVKGARALLGAPGIATSNKKLLGAPGLTTTNAGDRSTAKASSTSYTSPWTKGPWPTLATPL